MSFNQTNEMIKKELQTFNARRSLLGVLIIVAAAFILNFFLPKDPADFGVLCTIPALLMIVYIFVTKRIGATRKTGGSNRGYKPLTLTRA